MWNPRQITTLALCLITAVGAYTLPCSGQEVELKPPIEKDTASNSAVQSNSSDIPAHIQSNDKLQEPFPAHSDKDAAHSTDGRPLLRGVAEAASVNGHARLLATTPLTHHRDRSVHFIELNIKNISDQVVVVDANQAEVRINGQVYRPCDAKELQHDAQSTLSTGGKLAVAGVSAMSLGLAGDIFYEFITPGQNRKRDLSVALGRDGTRHEVEVENFGKRVLMPGDETQGWLGFDAATLPQVDSIRVPVSYMPPSLPSAVLTVPVDKPTRKVLPSASN
jgi:orotidine-5'-phosphate decarboxylase